MNAEQIVREFFEALNAHDAIKAGNYMTDDFVESGFLPQAPPVNKQQSIENNKAFFQAFSDFNFHIENVTVHGDQVSVKLRVTGTHDGTLQGEPPIPPTGKKFSVPDKMIFTVKGEKLAKQQFELPADGGPAEAFKQLGIHP